MILGLASVITFAPAGIAKLFGFADSYNKAPGTFAVGYAAAFFTLAICTFVPTPRTLKSAAPVTVAILVLLNFGGCVAIWKELGAIT